MSEKQDLIDAVDEFAEAMKKRLISKYEQGWCGWNTGLCSDLPERMLKNAARGCIKRDAKSLIDTANLAMMVWRES